MSLTQLGDGTGTRTWGGKWLLTVSAFLERVSFVAGLVTFPFDNFVCAATVSLVDLGFLPDFFVGSPGAGASVTDPSVGGPDFPFLFVVPAASGSPLPAPKPGIEPPTAGSGDNSTEMADGFAFVTCCACLLSVSLRSTAWGVIDDCQMLEALVNAVGACSGIGAALLPLRNGVFLVAFGTRSQIDGNSGDDEIITMESWHAIRAGEEECRSAVAMLDLSSRENPMRPARPSPTQKVLRGVRLEVCRMDRGHCSQGFVRTAAPKVPLGPARDVLSSA